jgi:hypothetical protein
MSTPYRYLLLLLGCLGLLSGALHAQTLNWGSAVFSDPVDIKGDTLDDTYTFELGSFVNGFTPDSSNTRIGIPIGRLSEPPHTMGW